MLELLRICVAEFLLRVAIFIYPELEPNKKEPTIPERRVKRFELLQVVADLYANKTVTLYGEHAGYFGEVLDELHKRGVPPKDIKVMTSIMNPAGNPSTSDQIRIRLEVVDCDHPLQNRSSYHDSSIKCDKCNCIIEQFGEPIIPPTQL